MAYKNNASEEHAFKRIGKEFKKHNLKNRLLFYGREAFLIEWAVDTLLEEYVNEACRDMDFSKLDGNLVSLDQIKNHCETLPFLSEKRVVLISDFKLLEGAKVKGFDETEEKALLEYIKSLPESCMLVMTADSIDKRKKIIKTISECGSIYEFNELDEKSLKAFVEKRFREAGKTVRPTVIAEMISSSGYYDKETDYNLLNFINDIKKVIAHNESSEIRMEDVTDTISGNLDTNVFAMVDALGRDRKDEAFQLLHNLLLSGEKEYKLLALICSQFETILSVKEMKEEGRSFQDMKEILGIHEFRIKRAAQFSEKFSLTHLRRILQNAYEIDKNIKTGLLESSLALEMFIAEI